MILFLLTAFILFFNKNIEKNPVTLTMAAVAVCLSFINIYGLLLAGALSFVALIIFIVKSLGLTLTRNISQE